MFGLFKKKKAPLYNIYGVMLTIHAANVDDAIKKTDKILKKVDKRINFYFSFENPVYKEDEEDENNNNKK